MTELLSSCPDVLGSLMEAHFLNTLRRHRKRGSVHKFAGMARREKREARIKHQQELDHAFKQVRDREVRGYATINKYQWKEVV